MVHGKYQTLAKLYITVCQTENQILLSKLQNIRFKQVRLQEEKSSHLHQEETEEERKNGLISIQSP